METVQLQHAITAIIQRLDELLRLVRAGVEKIPPLPPPVVVPIDAPDPRYYSDAPAGQENRTVYAAAL